jgi:hypothetical protein
MKSKWTPALGEKMVELAARGMLDAEICRSVGLGRSSFYAYQTEHPDFSDSLKGAKSRVDDTVEAAMLRRALGYETTETEGEPITDAEGRQTIRITKVKRVHVEPNVTAQIFWLKNRRPKAWRDQHRVHQAFDPTNGLEGVTPEEEAEVQAAVEHILGSSGGNGDGR